MVAGHGLGWASELSETQNYAYWYASECACAGLGAPDFPGQIFGFFGI